MPSMNQSGSWMAEGTFAAAEGPPPPVMSNWNACTSSWPEHVVGLRDRPRHGEHDAPLHELGDAARALADEAGEDVGLLEVGVAGVEDDGLALARTGG